MAVITKWVNVQVAIQSALAAAKTITAITKADPGVVSATGHGVADGEYALLTVQGMGQVNNRVFRADNGTADAFDLEGENTTNYDTFSSGTLNEITFGTTMATVTGLTASGGDFDFEDTTTIHDTQRSQVPNLASPGVYTLDNLWDVSDAALIALKQASDNQERRAIRFSFANGQKVVFTGYVGASLLPGGNAFEIVRTQVVLTMHGRPTVYAT